eukprot:scaffold973_cov399-Prasinococcus_capsulatus_cf.AAC.6
MPRSSSLAPARPHGGAAALRGDEARPSMLASRRSTEQQHQLDVDVARQRRVVAAARTDAPPGSKSIKP